MKHRIARNVLLSVIAFGAVAPAAHATAPPSERWHQIATKTFFGADAEIRSQGVATNGQDLVFSWQLGLTRTALASPGQLVFANPYAIPLDMVLQGSNHIGGIDAYAGKVYAPIEDGDGYNRPYIALYDAKTLLYTGTRWLLPQKLLTEGVPWVAVDPARGQIYTAEWNNTKLLNVHSISDLHVIRTVPLSIKLGRIQGARMLNGQLYAAEDNDTHKSIVAIDPDTGVVTPVFDRNLPAGTEAEGFTFVQSPQGTLMNTLEVAPDGLNVIYRTYLREAVSPDVRPHAHKHKKPKKPKKKRAG